MDPDLIPQEDDLHHPNFAASSGEEVVQAQPDDFEIYCGKTSAPTVHGITTDLVLRLCKDIPHHCNYKVAFDNYFTSIQLMKELKRNGILSVGTIRQNRMYGAQKLLCPEKELKKQGRGSYDWRVDASSNITVVRWFDNNCVQLASTYIDQSCGENAKRWSAKENRYIEIPCPKMVKEYNKFMGGVDLCDMLLSLYRIKLRSNKWYMPIFHYLIKTSLTNGWLLYRRDMMSYSPQEKSMSLLDFQAKVAGDLVMAGKIPASLTRRVGRPSLQLETPAKRRKTTAAVEIPTGASRYDFVGHFAEYDDKQHRCRYCSAKKTYAKYICDVFLCHMKGRNCFMEFHKNNLYNHCASCKDYEFVCIFHIDFTFYFIFNGMRYISSSGIISLFSIKAIF